MENFLNEFLYIILTLIVLIGSAIIKIFEKKNQQGNDSSNGILSLFDDQDGDEGKDIPFYAEEEGQESFEKKENKKKVSPVIEMNEQQNIKPGKEQHDKEPKQLYDWRKGIVMSEILQRKHFTI